MLKFSKTTLAIFLASTVLFSNANAAGDIDSFQEKVNRIAAEHGVPAPDVRAEITGEVKSNVDQKSAEKIAQEEETERQLKNVSPIERIVAIDANTIRAIKARDGKIMYIIDNGRFAFVGKMVDVWNRKELNTIEDIADAISHIDLKRMGFHLEEVNHITIGTGPKHVTVMVDPQCGWCHRLMSEISGNEEYLKDFSFDLVLVPILGERSAQLAKHLYCAKTTDDAQKYEALKGGARAIEALEKQESCDAKNFENTSLVAQAIGIQSVPMIIADDGRFERGKPQDLRSFLYPQGNMSVKSEAK